MTDRPRGAQFHTPGLRVMHWLNAVAMIVMIGSGLTIYKYHPALPLDFGFPPALTIGSGDVTRSRALHNESGLANALYWHFAAMWLLAVNFIAYVAYGIVTGHFRRDFLLIRWRALVQDMAGALRGRLEHRLGSYNAAQRLLYAGVLFAIPADHSFRPRHLEAGAAAKAQKMTCEDDGIDGSGKIVEILERLL